MYRQKFHVLRASDLQEHRFTKDQSLIECDLLSPIQVNRLFSVVHSWPRRSHLGCKQQCAVAYSGFSSVEVFALASAPPTIEVGRAAKRRIAELWGLSGKKVADLPSSDGASNKPIGRFRDRLSSWRNTGEIMLYDLGWNHFSHSWSSLPGSRPSTKQ